MASSRLTWVYRRQNRAKDVPKDVLDEYKNIIRHLYLDQNMTRQEVISHLKDNHGFNLTTSQFAKATKQWGFYKQPRRALEATAFPEPEPLGAIFDIEVDAFGADDEDEYLFHIDSTLDTPKNAKDDEDSFKESSRNAGDTSLEAQKSHRKTRVSSNQCHVADVKSPTANAPDAQIPWALWFSPPGVLNRTQNVALVCDSFDCIEESISGRTIADENLMRQFLDLMRIAKSASWARSVISLLQDFHLLEAAEGDADQTSVLPYTTVQDRMLFHAYLSSIYSIIRGQENQARRHLGQFRQIRDELLASPDCSLNMWSILLIQGDTIHDDIPGDLVDRLNIDDGEFLLGDICAALGTESLNEDHYAEFISVLENGRPIPRVLSLLAKAPYTALSVIKCQHESARDVEKVAVNTVNDVHIFALPTSFPLVYKVFSISDVIQQLLQEVTHQITDESQREVPNTPLREFQWMNEYDIIVDGVVVNLVGQTF
ncbi:uncharacterized protein FFB14_10589 [Fusarium fujikuroi]|nr:uncharacterized protein FFB14_10589 [Fusarium fujikuroi]